MTERRCITPPGLASRLALEEVEVLVEVARKVLVLVLTRTTRTGTKRGGGEVDIDKTSARMRALIFKHLELEIFRILLDAARIYIRTNDKNIIIMWPSL